MNKTIKEKVKLTGVMEKPAIEPNITLKELFTNIIEIRTELAVMRRLNRNTVFKFNVWAFLVVILQILNLYVHFYL